MTNNTTDLMIQVLGRDIKPRNLNQRLLAINSKSLGSKQTFLSFSARIFCSYFSAATTEDNRR